MEYSERLRKNEDFSRVYREGRSKKSGSLIMYVRENGTDQNRIGVVVSKKVGNSVVRHRIKRLVKENYRLTELSYKKGYDLVIVARRSAAEADFYKIKKRLWELARSCRVIEVEDENCTEDHDQGYQGVSEVHFPL